MKSEKMAFKNNEQKDEKTVEIAKSEQRIIKGENE